MPLEAKLGVFIISIKIPGLVNINIYPMKKTKHFFKWLIASILATAPFVALAQSDMQSGLNSIYNVFPKGGIASSLTASGLIINIIKVLLFLSGMVAVLFVIVGGFWYITASGNEEQAEKGKTTLVNAIIGIIVVVLSYVIVNVIVNLVGGINNGLF